MPFSESSALRSYSQEEVQQILNLAIAKQAYEGEFSHDQLLEIAAEMEIEPGTLQQAEAQWQQQNSDLQRRQSFNHYRQARLKRRAGRYAIINTGLVLLNSLTGFAFLWSAYIALPWGVMLSLQAWNVYHTQGDAYERAFQSWSRQYQVKQWLEAHTRRLSQGWLGRLLKA